MENSTASSVTAQTPVSPIITPRHPPPSDILVKSHPDYLVRELGYRILYLYGYAFLVVAVTFGFYCKWE